MESSAVKIGYTCIDSALHYIRRRYLSSYSAEEARNILDDAIGEGLAEHRTEKVRDKNGKIVMLVDITQGLKSPTPLYAVMLPDYDDKGKYTTIGAVVDKDGREMLIDTGSFKPEEEPAQATVLQAPMKGAGMLKFVRPVGSMLVTYNDSKGVMQMLEVAQSSVVEVVQKILDGKHPNSDPQSVRVWKEAKVRSKIEIE